MYIDDTIIRFLYQPNMALEVVILLVLLCSFTRPQLLTAILAGLLLMRPNERFECFVSYPKLIYPLLALALFFYSDKERRREQLGFDKPLLYFIAVILVQTLLFHSADLSAHISYIIVGLLFYYAVTLFSTDLRGCRLLCTATIASCLCICGEALYYHFTEPAGSTIWKFFHTGLAEAARLQAWGNWGNANETAFIACIGVANVVFLCVRSKSALLYAAAAALIPFFTLVVFLTGSRAGLATLILIFMPVLFLLDMKAVKVVLVIVLAGAVIFSSSFSPQRVDADASREDRFDLRYGGVQIFKQYPVVGIGFQRANNELGGMQLHNTYLQALVETGVVGAPFLYYYLYLIGVNLYKVRRTYKNTGMPTTTISVAAGLFIGSLFYFMWGNQLLSLLFFLTMGQVATWMQLAVKENAPGVTGTA
jgi:O-antigen ligase